MVEKKKEIGYDVTVRYRDGGTDNFYGVKSARVLDNTLEIVEGTATTVHIVLGVVTHIRIVEVKK